VNRTDEKADAGLKAAGGLIGHGRGWVRTSDLSRVKGDEERADSAVNSPDKPGARDGG
jgi:hypothetical protein